MMKSIKLFYFIIIVILLSSCAISQPSEPTVVNSTATSTSINIPEEATPTDLPLRMVRNLDLNIPQDCFLWSNVTLDDIGKTMCVWGKLRSTIYNKDNLQINFGTSTGDFYILTDDTNPPHTISVDCVMITDEIQQIDGSPVIVWKRPNVLYFWDCE